MGERRYIEPGWFTRNVFNRLVALATRLGVSVWGSRVLRVRGVTDWVRNIRAAGEGELRLGRRTESFRAHELSDAEKPPVLRAYLRRWKMEVGAFFEGADASSSDDELPRIAPNHPVFRIDPAR